MPIRVLDSEGYGNVFDIAEGVSFATDNGADVINLSLGTPSRSLLLQLMIDEAIASDTVVAAAAGNANSDVPEYPAAGDGSAASADGLVAVSSVNKQEQRSGFANYRSRGSTSPPLAPISGAPTRETISTRRRAAPRCRRPSSPAQAALIGRVNTALNPAEVEATIHCGARPLAATTPPTPLGHGHADVGRSLTRLQQGTCP